MKKLYRSTTDRMLGGVCAGIAKYLNMDVTVVRVIAVLLAVFGTGGVWAYIICLLVIPEDLDEQERACLSADHPRLTETIRMIIEGQEKTLREIGSELQEKEKRQNSLTEQKAVAEKNNGLLKQRKDAERTLQEEERKKEAVDALRSRVSLAEAAEKVLPYDQTRKKAKTDLETVLQKIAELEEGGKCLEQRKQTLEAGKTETDERCNAQIDQRSSRITDLHAILDYYDELDKSLRQYRDAKARAEEAAAAAEASAKELKKKETRMQELRLLMTSLQDAGEAAVQNAERAVREKVRPQFFEMNRKALNYGSAAIKGDV